MNKTIVFAALVALTALTALPAKANVFSQDNEQRFVKFSQRIGQFEEDILNIRGLRPECLQDILNVAGGLSDHIGKMYMLVSIADAMKDSQDEQEVLRWLQIHLAFMPGMLTNHRRQINLAMNYCSGNGMVAVKGQELLRLHDDAGSWTAWISKKIGR